MRDPFQFEFLVFGIPGFLFEPALLSSLSLLEESVCLCLTYLLSTVNMAAITETPQQSVLTAQIFKIFHDIREQLVLEGGLDDLPLTFPIVEMAPSSEMSNFLGMCHFATRYETAADMKRQNFSQEVECISMRVLCVPTESTKEDEENHFHLLRLIPTLLHEFAHVTTELGRSLSEQDLSCRNRKLKQMEHFSHDDFFYSHFRRILKAAEQLGIYSLPNTPNKYNIPALRRFDQVDLEVCPLPLCGSSKVYGGHLEVSTEGSYEIVEIAPVVTSLNLTIINGKGVRKFVQLKDIDFEGLKQAIAKKYSLKSKFKLQTPQGDEIDLSSFPSVKTGDTLHLITVHA